MADTPRIALKHPFTSPTGQRIEELSITRLKRKDWRDASKFSQDENDREDFLLGRMTGLLAEDIQTLDIADYKVLVDCFQEMVGV